MSVKSITVCMLSSGEETLSPRLVGVMKRFMMKLVHVGVPVHMDMAINDLHDLVIVWPCALYPGTPSLGSLSAFLSALCSKSLALSRNMEPWKKSVMCDCHSIIWRHTVK